MRSQFLPIALATSLVLLVPNSSSFAETGPGTAYSDWAAGILFSVSGFDASIYGDPDQDGVPNFMEFAAGTHPLIADAPDSHQLPPVRNGADDGTIFSFPAVPGLTEVAWSYWLSNDLTTWRNATGEASYSSIPAGSIEHILVEVPDGGTMADTLFGQAGWSWAGGAAGDSLVGYAFDGNSSSPTSSATSWITGAAYDASRLGSITGPSGVPTSTSVGGASGTDTTAVPASTWFRSDAPNDNKSDNEPFIGGIANTHDFHGVLSFDLSALAGATSVTDVTIKLPQEGGIFDNRSGSINNIAVTLQELTLTPTNTATWNTYDGSNNWPGGAGGLGDVTDPSFTSNTFNLDLLVEDNADTATIVIPSSGALESLILSNAGGRIDFLWRVPLADGGAAGTGRNFVVFDGAGAGTTGSLDSSPRIDVDYVTTGGANPYAQVPSDETGSSLSSALASNDYHEFEINVTNPGADILTLAFDHMGSADAADFTSNIAVFGSSDGFASAPTESEALYTSSALVTTSQDAFSPVASVNVPLALENFGTTLTIRLYFFDDANDPLSITGIDNIGMHGFSPENLLIAYGFDGGQASPTSTPVASITGLDLTTPIGGISTPNENSYASASETDATLAAAITAGDYHEVAITVTDPESQILSLRYDHHGTAGPSAFTSNIAVFTSTDGFAATPTAGEALDISTETVTTGQVATDPISSSEVPLSMSNFSGTLTIRFYFFDDSSETNNHNRVDSIELIGDAPGPGTAAVEVIATANYDIQILSPGFRLGVVSGGCAVLPPDSSAGLRFLGSAATSSEFVSQIGDTSTYRVTNGNGETALVDLAALPHTIEVNVTLENAQTGAISMRTGSPGPASYGLADRGGYGSNANLANTQQTYPMTHNGHPYRFISSFLIWPQQGVAGMSFDRGNGSVSTGPDYYQMENTTSSNTAQKFYYFIGSMEEIYAAHRSTRIAEGYPGVAPKMVGFEAGWESWDILRWNTNAQTCQNVVNDYLTRGYDLKWMVTGSGFWDNTDTIIGGGTTTTFGEFHPTKYPDPPAPGEITLRQFATNNDIFWMIGQRTNFVKLGGPFVNPSGPGESGQVNYATSPDTQAGLDNDYFLKDSGGTEIELTSTVFPVVASHVVDGNAPGAASWFKNLYDIWGVDGVKEDTMLSTPDHTIYNAPMREIATSGDLVMARCAAYSAPGTLSRINDTGGASSMSQRGPINYLQYAAVGAPNVYSDSVGFGNAGNVNRTLRHGWFLSLTAGFSFSNAPWNTGWSAPNEAKFKKIYDFHYQFAPYMYSAAVDSHNTGYPYTMTPLPIAFPQDSATYDLANSTNKQFEWLIGESMLATPVLADNSGNSTTLNVYLPAGKWIDYESGSQHTGPTTLSSFSMPHDKTPVFIGGKGVVVSRISNVVPFEAVVFPIADGGSSYTFHHPAGGDTTIVNNNGGWNTATLVVTNTTTSSPVSFTPDPTTGAISFDISPGNNYELSAGL